MKKYIFLLLFFLFLNPATAQILKIIDGDTIKIDGETIRFSGIDTPETNYYRKYKQVCYLNDKKFYCGEYSKQKLIERVGKNSVTCKREKKKDQYGRTLAECFVNGESLSRYMVKNGFAFDFPKYSKKKFAEDQEYAKKNALGLWIMDFHYPWNWRYKVRNLKKTKFPWKEFNVQKIYLLDNGKIIYIEQHSRGDAIWEKNEKTNELKKISGLWGFINLARQCELVKERDIYFGTNLEYYMAGGTNIDDPTIRIFNLYDPSPWRDSDLGIVPDMDYTKQWCTFYEPLYSDPSNS
jgi:endonuclease YncB( thermonuclease family)|tara:strand:- start:324 stop:1205 length:882 start_codon:yes stop_codon:yes gene_type:complete